jgi:hypothetical protein
MHLFSHNPSKSWAVLEGRFTHSWPIPRTAVLAQNLSR